MWNVGDDVTTAYGKGIIINYRIDDGMYEIQLENSARLFTTMMKQNGTLKRTTMELNAAFEAYEVMRKLNFELECSEAGILNSDMDHTKCTTCILLKGPVKKPSRQQPPPLRLPSFRKQRSTEEVKTNSDQTNILITKKNSHKTCLLCGSPTCSKHCSIEFRKEKITLCLRCVESLEFNFDNNNQTDEDDMDTLNKVLAKRLHHLVDLYDRALLLLNYSSSFLLQVATSLDQSTKKTNTMGIGGSSVGVVSGVLGVAAACTIFTPVGPPLILASLVFGGSAAAVHTGSEAIKYFSEPHHVADRILALYGMVQNMHRKIHQMRESTLDPYLDKAIMNLALILKDDNMFRPNPLNKNIETMNDHDRNVSATAWTTTGMQVGCNAAILQARLSGETSAGAVSRFMTRAGTNLSLGANLAQFAGGALSAVTLVLEARTLANTIDQIRKGSPCEKANALRLIHNEIPKLLPTHAMDAICQAFLKVRVMHVASQTLLQRQQSLEQSEIRTTNNDDDLGDILLVEEVITSLEYPHAQQQHGTTSTTTATTTSYVKYDTKSTSEISKPSLFERILHYKERETAEKAKLSLIV
jgi:hypothetical protein